MEGIAVPSPQPSIFRNSSAVQPAPKQTPPRSKASATTKSAKNTAPSSKATQDGAAAKPKQSKSRNGCLTCKAKRLKCDETKPSCQQCHKRSVTCGGYKKDFKWRPFEETAVANKAIPSRKRSSVPSARPMDFTTASSPNSDASTPSLDLGTPRIQEQEGFFHATAPSPPPLPSSHSMPEPHFDHPPFIGMSNPSSMRELPPPRFERDNVTKSLSSLFEDVQLPPVSPRPSHSGQSPRLIDLLSPGSQLNALPGTVNVPPVTPPLTVSPLVPICDYPSFQGTSGDDDDVEEIIRSPILDNDSWSVPGPSHSRAYSASPIQTHTSFPLYISPEVQVGSPEMLLTRFDKQTCGILSVKDGPTENPWRTLIWPLARDSPALYHAIASMTAFHTCREKLALRLNGMEHMRNSIRALATNIDKMRTDTALATTLVLAFAESWDQHISTGIEHLRGAKILVKQALVSHRNQRATGEDLARLRFLCNTWVYMDVISRLTSIDDDDGNEFDNLLGFMHDSRLYNNDCEVDPLMGCATTLFPLIGRAATLCRRIRKFETNSYEIISQANDLKQDIEHWLPPPSSTFERPEDPSSEVLHALQTAEAYRYATLLYLHQAVPEIPSLTTAQLAKKVLVYLATVPLSSRLVIVQIYPLLAAGCEANQPEDRLWVEKRWQSMGSRMLIGNIDRCWEVMQEVWLRRDMVEAAKMAAIDSKRLQVPAGLQATHSEAFKRKFEGDVVVEDDGVLLNGREKKRRQSRESGSFSGSFSHPSVARQRVESVTEDLDPELTVRGRLHWVGVMKDWGWEILLG